MPPSTEDLFGPLEPKPFESLVSNEQILKALDSPGSPFETEQRLIHERLQTVYRDLPASLRDVWASCAKMYAKRNYIVFKDERYTFEQVWKDSLKIATWLQASFQVRKGDRVGIAARNYPEFVKTYWAIHLLGAVACPLNSFNDGATLAFSIRDVSCRVVIVDGERYDRLEPLLDSVVRGAADTDVVPMLTSETAGSFSAQATTATEPSKPVAGIVVLPWKGAERVTSENAKHWLQRGQADRIFDYEALMNTTESDNSLPPTEISPEDHATILFTSGTTGKPKGVLSTQRQSLACLKLLTGSVPKALMRRGRPLPPPPDPSSLDQSIVLLLVPLMHTTGLHSGLTLATIVGNTLVMMPTYKRDDAISVIQRENVRVILGIGFMVREIVLSGAKMPSLESISHGGSAAASELPGEIRKHFPRAGTGIGYGLTEINGVATQNVMDDYFHKPSSVGTTAIGVELLIVNPENGNKTPQGQTGELLIRTPGRALGYWNRPRETAAAFLNDGWFRTGDLALFDSDGYLFIVDRVKDIIVRGGENISCTQVESGIYNHPGIIHCVAVSIPCKRLGERVGIVCIPRDDVKQWPSEKEILAEAVKVLPRYAVPEYVWVRSEPFTRNQSGKVLRSAVRKEVLDRIKEQAWSPEPENKARL